MHNDSKIIKKYVNFGSVTRPAPLSNYHDCLAVKHSMEKYLTNWNIF